HGISGFPCRSTTASATSRGRSDAPGPYSADTTAHSAQSPTPYEAFSTLHPVTTRPSSTSAAAPTGNPEYGQYARVMASRAASRRPAQSISIGPILLRDDPPAPGTRLAFPGGTPPSPRDTVLSCLTPPVPEPVRGRHAEPLAGQRQDEQGRQVRREGHQLAGDDVAHQEPGEQPDRRDQRQDGAEVGVADLAAPRVGDDLRAQPARPHRLPDRDADQQDRHEQQQRVDGLPAAADVHRVGVAEQQRARGQAAGPPVAEDHGGEADEAAAVGLAVLVEGRGDGDEERARQPGERARD